MPNPETSLAVTLAILVALGSSALAVVSAGLIPAPAAGPARAAGRGPACQEWTDGCVICVRTPAGPACSTPGIACVRGQNRCLGD